MLRMKDGKRRRRVAKIQTSPGPSDAESVSEHRQLDNEAGGISEIIIEKDNPALKPAPGWHYLAIFLIPAVLYIVNPNWLFQNPGHMDPWYYFGLFKTFPRFHNLVPTYAGERMVWVFPGWVLVHLLGQVPGVIALHCSVFLASLYLLHDILRRLSDNQTAFAAAAVLGCHACFIGSNSWDYVESMSIALILATIALLVRGSSSPCPSRYVFFSGIAWAGVLYSYLAWAFLTPAYLYLVFRLIHKGRGTVREILSSAITVVCGGVAISLVLGSIYFLLGGHGIFFYINVISAIALSHITKNLVLMDPHWYRGASWLVFPLLAFAMAVVLALFSFLRKICLPDPCKAMIWFYLLCSFAMIYLTVRPLQLMAFSYFASVLMPGAFVILGITVLKVPTAMRGFLFYPTVAIGGLISIAPLAVRGLYTRELKYGLAVPLLLAVLAMIWRLIDQSSSALWSISVLFLSGASFGLAPGYATIAWTMDYRGRDISERVSRAMDAIIVRLPNDKYPVFWIDNYGSQLSAEYRGIMCSFITFRESMQSFPKVDRHYPPGTRIFTATEQQDITTGALYRLARAGMAATQVGQDLVRHNGTSYWITSLEVLPGTMANIRRGFQVVGLSDMDAAAFDTYHRASRRLGTKGFRVKRMTFAESGVYQFEIRYRLSGGSLTFGALSANDYGNAWIEQSKTPLEEDGEQVSWFRLGVKAGEPVDLALQRDSPLRERRDYFLTPPKLVVLRDTTNASPGAFDLVIEKPASASPPP
jgi:hypothetical protein